MKEVLYLFLDEGGNFDFSIKGTAYFSLTCVSAFRPFRVNAALEQYKYDCLEWGLATEYFHCVEDNRHVRKRVFEVIAQHLQGLRIDSLVVEKQKILFMREPRSFYSAMLGYVLNHVLGVYDMKSIQQIFVITDTLPLNQKRHLFEKSIKIYLAAMLPENASYRLYHHASKAHYGLQVADYCNWAIWRKWERGDDMYYQIIEPAIKSRLEVIEHDKRMFRVAAVQSK